MRRYRTIAGAAACLVVGTLLVLFGVDVARWGAALHDGDVAYRAAPEGNLWTAHTLLPAKFSRSALGIGDDIAYRQALRAFRLAQVSSPIISDPSVIVQRNDATVRLADIVLHSSDPARRSAAANLLGAIDYSDAVADYTNRTRLIVDASDRFTQAIAFDPANDDAKYNLELTLALGRAQGLSESGGGTNPAPGGKGSKGAGAGAPGTGY